MRVMVTGCSTKPRSVTSSCGNPFIRISFHGCGASPIYATLQPILSQPPSHTAPSRRMPFHLPSRISAHPIPSHPPNSILAHPTPPIQSNLTSHLVSYHHGLVLVGAKERRVPRLNAFCSLLHHDIYHSSLQVIPTHPHRHRHISRPTATATASATPPPPGHP